jgi:hypothetical protein
VEGRLICQGKFYVVCSLWDQSFLHCRTPRASSSDPNSNQVLRQSEALLMLADLNPASHSKTHSDLIEFKPSETRAFSIACQHRGTHSATAVSAVIASLSSFALDRSLQSQYNLPAVTIPQYARRSPRSCLPILYLSTCLSSLKCCNS